MKDDLEEYFSAYGDVISIKLARAHMYFLNAQAAVDEARLKKCEYLDVISSMESLEVKLDRVIPFIDKTKTVKKTILGLAELYDHFNVQIEKCNEVLAPFGEDHEGPKNMYLFILARILKDNRERVDWKNIHQYLFGLKSRCSITRRAFETLTAASPADPSFEVQKNQLRAAYNRAKDKW